MRLIATDDKRSVVCHNSVCLSVRYKDEACKTAEPIELPFWREWADSCGSKEPCIKWRPDPPRKGTLLKGHLVPAHCNVLTYGERTCQAHAAHEYNRHYEGDKTAMRPLAK